jgi:hypothetical protein
MPDNRLAQLLAQQGAAGIRNPVNRYLLGLPSTSPTAQDAQQLQTRNQEDMRRREAAQRENSLKDKLFKRFITVDQAGFGVPGKGVITGAALRPEVQEAFKDLGGVSAIDVTNMSPEEETALMMYLDPKWVNRHSDGNT